MAQDRKRKTKAEIALDKIPTVANMLTEEGHEGYVPDLGDKSLTLRMRLLIEQGLQAKDISLEKKVEWAFKGIGLFEGTKKNIWHNVGDKTKATAMEMDKKLAEHNVRVKKLQDDLLLENKPIIEKVDSILEIAEVDESLN